MRPNVEFRVDLPKKNPALAKSHLQRHVATRKKPPPRNSTLTDSQTDSSEVTFDKTTVYQ